MLSPAQSPHSARGESVVPDPRRRRDSGWFEGARQPRQGSSGLPLPAIRAAMRVAFDLGRFRPRLELPVLQSFCVPTPRRGSCAPASGRERGRPNRCAPISSQAIRCRAFADGQSGRRQLPRPCRSRSLRPKPLSQSLDNRGVEKVERRDSSAIRLDVPNAFRPVPHIRRSRRRISVMSSEENV